MFVSAIEKITAKTKQIHIASSDEDGQEVIEVPVRNGTVANLTLMALGSSAPEILLAIIGSNFESERLGPSTGGVSSFQLTGLHLAGAGGGLQGPDGDLGGRAQLPVLPFISYHCLISSGVVSGTPRTGQDMQLRAYKKKKSSSRRESVC